MAIKLSFQKVLGRPGRGEQAREGAARDSNDHDDLLNCRFVLRSARKPPEQHHHTGLYFMLPSNIIVISVLNLEIPTC